MATTASSPHTLANAPSTTALTGDLSFSLVMVLTYNLPVREGLHFFSQVVDDEIYDVASAPRPVFTASTSLAGDTCNQPVARAKELYVDNQLFDQRDPPPRSLEGHATRHLSLSVAISPCPAQRLSLAEFGGSTVADSPE